MRPLVSKRLIDWYRTNKRDLPWRGIRDPYAVLVSEVMLQQTRAAVVVPYFERFIERFPTPAALAETSETEALRYWEGLGYYRRLRNLQAAAAKIAAEGWPEDLRELPGVGDYTAAAIGSMAFDRHVTCVDANVRRVLSRLHAKDLTLSECADESTKAMGSHDAGTWNQTLMEFGAILCKPKSPLCAECPVRRDCKAHQSRRVEQFPPASPRPTATRHHVLVCAVKGGKVAVRRNPDGEWWAGLYSFPRAEVNAREAKAHALQRLGAKNATHLLTVRHTVTRYRLVLNAYRSDAVAVECEWVSTAKLDELPFPSPERKVVRALVGSL